MVPYRYVCDLQLELERTQGLTKGCPSPALEQALGYLWLQYGGLTHALQSLARVYHPDFSGIYAANRQGTQVYFARYSERLTNFSANLTAGFRDVVHIGASEGFGFSAELSWMGYPEGLLDARYRVEY